MKLPLMISVPHAGRQVPEEVREDCRLSLQEIIADGDEGAAEIYSLRDHVARFVTTDIARAVVDQNRSEDDRSKDGVVKTHTCHDVPIWRKPLDSATVELLLERHYRPYHALLSQPDQAVSLGLDCHTMAAIGPTVARDAGQVRPQVCLSNAGGTLPDAWFERLFQCFQQEFPGNVTLNEPFRGGQITRRHAAERPWVQIELSRAAFVERVEKRARVLNALTHFVETALT